MKDSFQLQGGLAIYRFSFQRLYLKAFSSGQHASYEFSLSFPQAGCGDAPSNGIRGIIDDEHCLSPCASRLCGHYSNKGRREPGFHFGGSTRRRHRQGQFRQPPRGSLICRQQPGVWNRLEKFSDKDLSSCSFVMREEREGASDTDNTE